MVTLQELASYVCYYGGTSLQTLQELEEDDIEQFTETGDLSYLRKAAKLSVIRQMMTDGVEFVLELTTGGAYYKPKKGWEILNSYLDGSVLKQTG